MTIHESQCVVCDHWSHVGYIPRELLLSYCLITRPCVGECPVMQCVTVESVYSTPAPFQRLARHAKRCFGADWYSSSDTTCFCIILRLRVCLYGCRHLRLLFSPAFSAFACFVHAVSVGFADFGARGDTSTHGVVEIFHPQCVGRRRRAQRKPGARVNMIQHATLYVCGLSTRS